MKFTGDFTVPALHTEVFERINAPVFFASCIEGVSGLTPEEARSFVCGNLRHG